MKLTLATIIQLIFLLIFSIVVSGQEPQNSECGTINHDFYYNQKTLSEISEYPWMGRVRYEKNKETWYQCYTVLISDRFTLLNAKCFNVNGTVVGVLLGDWNKGNDNRKSDCDDNGRCAPVPKLYEVETSYVHPNYSAANNLNDIAMLKLQNAITMYSDFIRPICMPSKDMQAFTYDNHLLDVTGWYLNGNLSEILAKSHARVVNLKTCESRMKDIYKMDKERSICALTCWDNYVYASGAMLMGTELKNDEPSRYYLIGINVYGQAKCVVRNPHIYCRVDRFLDWINEIIINDLIVPRRGDDDAVLV